MSRPIDDPPTPEELENQVASFFNRHSYGPFSCEKVSDTYLVFSSQSYKVQFELRIQGDYDAIEYEVYPVPAPSEELGSGTHRTDIMYNPSLTWQKHINRMLSSVSGIINGNINSLEER